VTPSWGESGFQLRSGDADKRRATWPRIAVLVGVFVLAIFVSRGCQNEQVRVTEEEAIEIAREEVDFVPTRTVVRLLRQGLDRAPFWFVQLSIPIGPDKDAGLFAKLTIVQIETETGAVVKVSNQSEADTRRAKRQAARQQAELDRAEAAEAGGSGEPAGDAAP
jgi:hypothetical protein